MWHTTHDTRTKAAHVPFFFFFWHQAFFFTFCVTKCGIATCDWMPLRNNDTASVMHILQFFCVFIIIFFFLNEVWLRSLRCRRCIHLSFMSHKVKSDMIGLSVTNGCAEYKSVDRIVDFLYICHRTKCEITSIVQLTEHVWKISRFVYGSGLYTPSMVSCTLLCRWIPYCSSCVYY